MPEKNACDDLKPKPSDSIVKATQILLDNKDRCDAMTRVLKLIVQQNSSGVMLEDYGRDPASLNVVLRFKAQ